jgi:hypothetical protein
MLIRVDPPKYVARKELTQEQKKMWFDKVKNAKNWKNPIEKSLILEDEDQIEDVIDSITWFVGGMTDFEVIKSMPYSISVRFWNQGYYNNIGA